MNSALKLSLELSQNSTGHCLFTDLQAVEFFNSYYKYVPTTLQNIVSTILNSLISPSFTPIHRPEADIIPSGPVFDKIPQPKLSLPCNDETIRDPCEFPFALLCETDEKILFDLCVTLKFGNPEEIFKACEELKTRVFKDFPCEVILQHSDLIKSLVGLVKISNQKNLISLANSALKVLNSLVLKLKYYKSFVAKPENRCASCVYKKMIVKAEYLEISVPCLKNEQWELGTPGPTMSLLSALEYIITEIPLDNLKTLAFALEI